MATEQTDKTKKSGLSRIDLMLLGQLMEQPMHGYEISDVLGSPEMEAWARLGKTSIYYSLGRLERTGHVSKHSERAGGKPARTVYSITDEGRKTFIFSLQDAVRTPPEHVDPFEIALYYASHLKPEVTSIRLRERLQRLEDAIDKMSTSVAAAAAEGDLSLKLALEHRLAIMRADFAFVVDFIDMLEAGHADAVGALRGELSSTMLHEVLRNLAAGRRTGVLTVRASNRTMHFRIENGELKGLSAGDAGSPDDGLHSAMMAFSGEYEFAGGIDVLDGEVAITGGLPQLILDATRGARDQAAFDRMLPEPDTLLDAYRGGLLEEADAFLQDEERRLLETVDGVRTVSELAAALGWTRNHLVGTAYPLWALGLLVRADSEKRDLVLAVAAYVRRWMQAVSLFAGGGGTRLLESDCAAATSAAGLPDFAGFTADSGSAGVPVSKSALVESARTYAELIRSCIAARLGERFVEDVSRGFMRDPSFSEGWLLNKYKIS